MILSFFQMAKGRIIATLVATLLSVLALLGIDVLSETTINQVTVFVTAFVTFIQFLGYSLFHLFITKRKLENHQVAQENLDRLR